jgi:hypothetical protein
MYYFGKTINEAFRKISWRLFFSLNPTPFPKKWVCPSFGYIVSDKKPKLNDTLQKKLDRCVSNTFLYTESVVETKLNTYNKTNKNRRFGLTYACIKNNISKHLSSDCVIIQADKNMGLFIISKHQLENIKHRESLHYILFSDGLECVLHDTTRCLNEFLFFLHDVNKEAHTFITRYNDKFKLCVPELYFLIKVNKLLHQPEDRNLSVLSCDLQYRPILPYNKFFLYAMSKVLASFFNSLLPLFPWVIGDTSGFLSWWNTNKCKCDVFYTADATNLYGSMPPDVIMSTLSLLFDLPHVKLFLKTNRTTLYVDDFSITKILKYTSFVLNNTFCTINNVIYKQNKGMPMGSPISPPLANLCLAYFEFVFFENNPPFVRLLDDIASFQDISTFTHIYPTCIKFNCESNMNKFLDVTICVDKSLKVYIKPFPTLPPHVASKTPESVKRNYFITQIKRALRICNNNLDHILEFLQWLTDEGLKKGYTKERLLVYFQDGMSDLKFPIEDDTGFFINKKKNLDVIHVIQKVPSLFDVNLSTIIERNTALLCTEFSFLRARITDTNVTKISLNKIL